MNTTLIEKTLANNVRLSLVHGDITEERVDAIVNAANSHLQHGGGVAFAISRKGGPAIQRESNTKEYVPVGEAALTTAGDLPCQHVIHAVGPQWGSGDEENKLRRAVTNSLKMADENQLKSISLPAVSSGIYGFPKDRCASVMLSAIEDYAGEQSDTSLREIRICLYDAPTIAAFRNEWEMRNA